MTALHFHSTASHLKVIAGHLLLILRTVKVLAGHFNLVWRTVALARRSLFSERAALKCACMTLSRDRGALSRVHAVTEGSRGSVAARGALRRVEPVACLSLIPRHHRLLCSDVVGELLLGQAAELGGTSEAALLPRSVTCGLHAKLTCNFHLTGLP